MRVKSVLHLARNIGHHRFGQCTICGNRTIFFSFNDGSASHAREQFHCALCKSVSRHRHVALEMLHAFERKETSLQKALPFFRNLKIYSASSGDAMNRVLGKDNPNYVVSEYFPDMPLGSEKNGVQCQNLESLTFKENTFDMVITEDVLEHVVNFRKALSEIHRVLKQGGFHIFTVPLLLDSPTIERAIVEENGNIKHLLPPEYHGDPIRGEILAFRTFGYDIFRVLSEVGFDSKLSPTFFQMMLKHAIADSYVVVSRKR